ncbi:WSCD family member AAEL009094-like [Neocloeon triangulifer]|uniref:WSCD family member AAEL009094-like n=1 Tax=Neocloeon triangulifer TaxID=2078957 RepID=UPI00286EF308|nr:WSCD family member AAEL009094-like [Neocloeon triangulifer]XP_059487764.1 WSCD family member AAEL009094-like [Neocloeon triangulifer]
MGHGRPTNSSPPHRAFGIIFHSLPSNAGRNRSSWCWWPGGMYWCRGRICALSLILGAYLAGVLLLSSISLDVDPRRYHFYKAVINPEETGKVPQIGLSGHHDVAASIRSAAAASSRRSKLHWCHQLHFKVPPGPVTALVSFPGSGNTWVRYLIQQATGTYTGSVYKDYGLLKNGFPAESVMNGSVVAVKTHEIGESARAPFAKAVLLIRAPGQAIQAEFNRQSGGHIGFAAPDRYRRNRGKYWRDFVTDKLSMWSNTYNDWLKNFPGPKHVLYYEQLVSDVERELRSLLKFLDVQVPEEHLTCALERREGIYRRRRRTLPFDPFTAAMKDALRAEQTQVYTALAAATNSSAPPVT